MAAIHTLKEKKIVKPLIKNAENAAKWDIFERCADLKKKDKNSSENKELTTTNNDEGSNMLFVLKTDEVLNNISTADLFWDKKSKRWIQRPSSLTKTDSLMVNVNICKDDMKQLSKQPLPETVQNSKIEVNGIADTGCSIL